MTLSSMDLTDADAGLVTLLRKLASQIDDDTANSQTYNTFGIRLKELNEGRGSVAEAVDEDEAFLKRR